MIEDDYRDLKAASAEVLHAWNKVKQELIAKGFDEISVDVLPVLVALIGPMRNLGKATELLSARTVVDTSKDYDRRRKR